MTVRKERITFDPYGRCIRLTNDIVELVVTLDVGLRVISYGLKGRENMFLQGTEATVKYDEFSVWKIKGGHRLWHTPEKYPRNYVPDDEAIKYEEIENGVRIIQKLEKWTQIVKEMEITLNPDSSEVKIIHKLTNKNAWPVEFGVWAMSAMAPGGILVVPQAKRDTGVECNRVMSLWPYSDMTDKRVFWGKEYIFLKQDVNAAIPFKFGISHEDGWAAYINNNILFLKEYQPIENAKYPDYGCSFEAYSCSTFLEVETLSPLKLMQPDESATHAEKWRLFDHIAVPENEQQVDRIKALL
jgi:hypothetical protein